MLATGREQGSLWAPIRADTALAGASLRAGSNDWPARRRVGGQRNCCAIPTPGTADTAGHSRCLRIGARDGRQAGCCSAALPGARPCRSGGPLRSGAGATGTTGPPVVAAMHHRRGSRQLRRRFPGVSGLASATPGAQAAAALHDGHPHGRRVRPRAMYPKLAKPGTSRDARDVHPSDASSCTARKLHWTGLTFCADHPARKPARLGRAARAQRQSHGRGQPGCRHQPSVPSAVSGFRRGGQDTIAPNPVLPLDRIAPVRA